MDNEDISHLIKDGWFIEKQALWPGQALTLQVKKVLSYSKSTFQEILVFESETYGKVLVLDGVIQITERDEFTYQEMISHVPLFTHPSPKTVLVIGGGDGAVLREILKHDCVQQVFLCEIDEQVVTTSLKYFSQPDSLDSQRSFQDPRVKLCLQDGFKFLSETCKNDNLLFDVVIVDSSDPVGPAESLFSSLFFLKLKEVLKEDGIICTQAESIFLHLDLIVELIKTCQNIFNRVSYFTTMIPTYPGGSIGFVLCQQNNMSRSDVTHSSLEQINKQRITDYERLVLNKSFRYYTDKIHSASFVLPAFVIEKFSTI